MTLPYQIAVLFDVPEPVSSIQAAKHTIGKRIGVKLDDRLVDMPKDLQRAVVMLARHYRSGK